MADEPTNEENEEEPETSLRDDLEAAIEEHEDAESGETENAPEGEEGGEEKPASGTDGDESHIGDAEGEAVPAGINAPIGMSAEIREAWKDVPQSVKEYVVGREQEMTTTMANTGEARKTHTALTELAQSYAPILAAEGAETPMAAVEGLFRTVAELRVGSPQQIASKMATLIGHYGVDIKMLDTALSGQPLASPEEDRMGKMLDQRLAPFQEMLTSNQNNANAQNQANQTAVNTELQEFAKGAEFLSDVRHDMADLIDMASKRGQIMTFEQAYAKACAINPQISGVMEKRASDAALVAGGEKANGKLNASASLRSGPGESNAPASDGTLRGDIEAAWADAE